jgi:hypothetical protein
LILSSIIAVPGFSGESNDISKSIPGNLSLIISSFIPSRIEINAKIMNDNKVMVYAKFYSWSGRHITDISTADRSGGSLFSGPGEDQTNDPIKIESIDYINHTYIIRITPFNLQECDPDKRASISSADGRSEFEYIFKKAGCQDLSLLKNINIEVYITTPREVLKTTGKVLNANLVYYQFNSGDLSEGILIYVEY